MNYIPDYYEDIAEMANSIVLIWSRTGTIKYINEYGSRFFNYEKEEIIGRNILGTIVPETDSAGRKQSRLMRDICRDPEQYIKNVNENMLSSGERVWIAWTNKAVQEDKKNTYDILSVGNDITLQKQLENELIAARNELEDRVRERTSKLNTVYGELQSLILRLAAAEEEEKKRISREIHDQIGQNLSTIGLNLNLIRSGLKDPSDSALSFIDDSLTLLRDTTRKVRHILAELRLPVLDDYGLCAALKWYSREFSERTGIECIVKGIDLNPRPEAHIESAFFLIAREALDNAAKHSKATRVGIDLNVEENILRLLISDNGVGCKGRRGRKPKVKGMGLLSMSERAVLIGAVCTISSKTGKGTHVLLEIPL
ncbi:MAG: PAS domain-containing sensor histidine kinase [Syntrophorhabdaceae bacterium]